jgi:hypothetical protein
MPTYAQNKQHIYKWREQKTLYKQLQSTEKKNSLETRIKDIFSDFTLILYFKIKLKSI